MNTTCCYQDIKESLQNRSYKFNDSIYIVKSRKKAEREGSTFYFISNQCSPINHRHIFIMLHGNVPLLDFPLLFTISTYLLILSSQQFFSHYIIVVSLKSIFTFCFWYSMECKTHVQLNPTDFNNVVFYGVSKIQRRKYLDFNIIK